MSTFVRKCTPLTIPNGQTTSNVLSAASDYEDAISLLLQAPASLDVLTFTIEVSDDNSTFVTFQSGDTPADVNPPGAGKARAYFDIVGALYFRIKASGAVGAARTWKVTKNVKY